MKGVEMSYEGQTFYLLKDGRLRVTDCWSDAPPDAEWYCEVDNTNGYLENCPQTHEPTMNEVGFIDHWREDHYGNRYAVKSSRYAPVNGPGLNEWRKVK